MLCSGSGTKISGNCMKVSGSGSQSKWKPDNFEDDSIPYMLENPSCDSCDEVMLWEPPSVYRTQCSHGTELFLTQLLVTLGSHRNVDALSASEPDCIAGWRRPSCKAGHCNIRSLERTSLDFRRGLPFRVLERIFSRICLGSSMS